MLMPEIGFEPPLALFARRRTGSTSSAAWFALPVSFLALEHGEGQADAIEALMGGFEVERIRDLAGIERVRRGAESRVTGPRGEAGLGWRGERRRVARRAAC